MDFLIKTLMLLTSVFLILLILIQRGRGGGLAGAFGGLGGQSAFGTKAGDLFTRITIGVAAFWIILCIGALKILHSGGPGLLRDVGGPDQRPGAQAPLAPGGTQPAGQPAGGAPAAGGDAPAAGDTAPGAAPSGPSQPTTPDAPR